MPVTLTVPALVTGVDTAVGSTDGKPVEVVCPVTFTVPAVGVCATVEDNKPPVPATLARLSKASVIAVGTKPAESNN